MTETVTIEMRRELAEELAATLEHEVATADEFQTTEQVMKDSAQVIRNTLNDD